MAQSVRLFPMQVSETDFKSPEPTLKSQMWLCGRQRQEDHWGLLVAGLTPGSESLSQENNMESEQ